MIIDIHSHLIKSDGKYLIEDLLADMKRFNIGKRVISTDCGDSIQQSNQDIADFVNQYPEQLIGCAIINPSLPTALDDIKHALSLPQIKMIEFDSFKHGYYPDHCSGLTQVLEVINEAKMPVKLFSGIGAKAMPHQWIAHTEKYSNISFIYLHMGCFDYGYSCVDIVEHHENAYIETSNQYELQIMRKAFEHLPAEKIIFGSSYPEKFTRCGIEIFDLFKLTNSTKAKLFEANAREILSIK
ncbi:MAG: amidohydrolase family protein [Erysipelotrichaceae bacterium]